MDSDVYLCCTLKEACRRMVNVDVGSANVFTYTVSCTLVSDRGLELSETPRIHQ